MLLIAVGTTIADRPPGGPSPVFSAPRPIRVKSATAFYAAFCPCFGESAGGLHLYLRASRGLWRLRYSVPLEMRLRISLALRSRRNRVALTERPAFPWQFFPRLVGTASDAPAVVSMTPISLTILDKSLPNTDGHLITTELESWRGFLWQPWPGAYDGGYAAPRYPIMEAFI